MIKSITQNNDFILIAELPSAIIQNCQQTPNHMEATKWLKCHSISMYRMFSVFLKWQITWILTNIFSCHDRQFKHFKSVQFLTKIKWLIIDH